MNVAPHNDVAFLLPGKMHADARELKAVASKNARTAVNAGYMAILMFEHLHQNP